LLLTVFAQRQIVAGLTAGAVKGGQPDDPGDPGAGPPRSTGAPAS
jgi:hypothetical protein